MLEYLEQLVKERKWEEALVIAERLVQNSDNTAEDMLRINLALIAARTMIGEYSGVVTLGDHALEMATDLRNWDAYLTICHYVGFSFTCLNQSDQAKHYWLLYIEHLHKYPGDHLFEVVTWFNLGVTSLAEKDTAMSVHYYEQAKRVTLARGTKRQLLGVNHALINAYTLLQEFEKVPRLLAQTLNYLMNNKDAEDWTKALFYHFKVRAEFAYATRRFERARLIATRCLSLAKEFPEHRYNMHMILANIAQELQDHQEMIAHLTAARVAAIRARRYDCELIAAEGLYAILQGHSVDGDKEMVTQLPSSWFDSDDLKISN